ncbi:MAG: MFS transporter [Patescibacteria group bacterium]|nr:MFS transporter [Patescibacteria group bacterium]
MDILKNTLRSNDLVNALKNRSFFLMMLSEFFSQLSYNMQNFVIIFIIYEIYKSNSAVSGVILSFTIPAVVFSIFAGVYVDRWEKKKVLFITNLLRGFILLLFLIPTTRLSIFYSLTFLLSIVTQFFLPAEAPMIPLLVERKLLIAANSFFTIGIYTTVLLGYILSGPVLLSLGNTNTFILLSILYFASAIFILFIKTAKKDKVVEETEDTGIIVSFIREFKQVCSFIKNTRKVAGALLLLTISQGLLYIFAALGPGYVSDILESRVENLSWVLLAPAAFGMIVGSLLIGSMSNKFNLRNMITAGFITAGIIFILLPMASKVESYRIVQFLNIYLPHLFEITIEHLIMFFAFIGGIANSMVFVPSNTRIQEYTSNEYRGRVYGLLNALIGGVSFLPVALAGGMADIFGVGSVIVTIGIGILIFGISRIFY